MAVVDYQDSNATTHGLSNRTGENNCFINSVIQVLWHLDIFRDHFGQLQEHVCHELECVFCTLKELFVNFQYSESITLPPNFVRKAMANCYKNTGRFQISRMDYAVECYEAVLKQLHTQITGTDWDTTCTHAQCLPHKIFSYSSCQIDKCACGATSEPFPSEDILFYISADNLLKVVKKSNFSHKVILRDGNAFGQILKECLTTDKKHKCPESSNCKKSSQVETMLLRSPYTINLSLSWSSEISTKERVVDVLTSVGHNINIKQMFSLSLDEVAGSKEYNLSGIINYYGHHFSAFVYNTNLSKWVFCDDASFREVGDNWYDVIELVKRAKYQPELLVYSIRGVDIWKEEENRKPVPQIPPKPKLTDYKPYLTPQSSTNTAPTSQAPQAPKLIMTDYKSYLTPQSSTNTAPTSQAPQAPKLIMTDYKSYLTPPSTTNTVPTSQAPQAPIHGTYPQVPILPAHLEPSNNITSIQDVIPMTNVLQVASCPQLPQVSIFPSAPLPNQNEIMKREIKYPPNYGTQPNPKPRKSSQIPNKQNPVVLLKMEKKQDNPTLTTIQPRKNANTNNNQESDLLLDYVSVSSNSLAEFEAIKVEAPDIASAPNLLLDIQDHSNLGKARKIARHDVIDSETRIDEPNLIDFTVISPVRPDDVYDEIFSNSASNSLPSSLNIPSSNTRYHARSQVWENIPSNTDNHPV